MGTQLVGRMSLPSGQNLWVEHREEVIPKLPVTRGKLTKFRMSSGTSLEGQGDLRTIVFVESDGGHKALMECKVEYKGKATAP
jgi:hypothetical protein